MTSYMTSLYKFKFICNGIRRPLFLAPTYYHLMCGLQLNNCSFITLENTS